jgi:hypothetical protein
MKPCILPWINFGTNTFGKPRVCGYSSKTSDEWSFNSKYFKEIRNSFLNNEWPENCKRCKHVEELGGTSKRMDENHMWYNKYEHLIDKNVVNYYPPHIDVRTGTICNFKCIHCGPASSSKWMEDYELICNYGYDFPLVDDKWIAQDSKFWDNLDISQIKRYNFLGGESFYNKRHNEFIKRLNESEYAKDVEIAYVSNGSLKFDNMDNFKKVRLRLSVDCAEEAGEYFRYGIKWDEWCNNISNFPSNFDVSFQWTCSNVSMFYLKDTYTYMRTEFPDIRFLFENHVTEPYHMSAQNLPMKIKEQICKNIDFIDMPKSYVNYMMEKDGWSSHGKIFINYLDDLDQARKIDWRTSFSEMNFALCQ